MGENKPGKKLYDPWDMSPVTDQQVAYLKEMVRRFHVEADWSSLDTTQASSALDKFNTIRKALKMPFEAMDGMDTSRYA